MFHFPFLKSSEQKCHKKFINLNEISLIKEIMSWKEMTVRNVDVINELCMQQLAFHFAAKELKTARASRFEQCFFYNELISFSQLFY